MSYEFDVQLEDLTYTGVFSRPLFELWGNGGKIISGIYETLKPYGVSLQNIQMETAQRKASDPVISATIGSIGTYRFAFDKMEFVFSGLSEQSLAAIPQILSATRGWIKAAVPTVDLSAHRCVYNGHGSLKGIAVEDLLRTVGTKPLKSTGIDQGSGIIYHHRVPDLGWTTQIILDRSLRIADALYLMLAIDLVSEDLEYDALLAQGRAYLAEALKEVNVAFPNSGT